MNKFKKSSSFLDSNKFLLWILKPRCKTHSRTMNFTPHIVTTNSPTVKNWKTIENVSFQLPFNVQSEIKVKLLESAQKTHSLYHFTPPFLAHSNLFCSAYYFIVTWGRIHMFPHTEKTLAQQTFLFSMDNTPLTQKGRKKKRKSRINSFRM